MVTGAWASYLRVRLSRAVMGLWNRLARHPLFLVQRDEVDVHGAASFKLRPTLAFTLWVLAGLLLISFVLADGIIWAGLGVLLGTIWTACQLRRLSTLSKMAASMSSRVDKNYFRMSPRAAERTAILGWLPVAVALLLGSMVAVAVNKNCFSSRLYGPHWYFVCGVVLLSFYGIATFFGPSLPLMNSWYRSLPSPMKALIDAVADENKKMRFPAFAWKIMPNTSQYLHIAGTYLALFSVDQQDRPVWRRSRTGVLWYFAPILVPFAALALAPLCIDIVPKGELVGLDKGLKLQLGTASLVWAVWSMCYFTELTTRDFIRPLQHAGLKQRNLPAVIFAFPGLIQRHEIARFFTGSGKVAYDFVIVLLVPAYMGYLGLFSDPEAERKPYASLNKPSITCPSR